MSQGWKRDCYQLGLVRTLGVGGAIALTLVEIAIAVGNPAFAQITPDGSLEAESSVVSSDRNIRGLPGVLIEGGAARGVNLFQSFSEFNVRELQRVYFANPAGIENILSRVTGSNPSNILGTLGVDGRANLFLLNPNGILFGANAQLDIAGSFVASTADSLTFGDNLQFSAINPEAAPLLTVNLRPGLQYGTNYRGNIANAGNLAVGQGQTLSLAGSTVNSTGSLEAPSGTVQILGNSVALLDNARIDVSGVGGGLGGAIEIAARNRVAITDSELISESDNNIDSGFSEIGIVAREGSVLLDGVTISTTNFGTASAGDVVITARDQISIVGSQLTSESNTSNTSNNDFSTIEIVATEGSVALERVEISTTNSGTGFAGDVIINARDRVSIFNSSGQDDSGNELGIFSQGNFGRLFITSDGSISLDSTRVSTTNFNPSSSGDIIISAPEQVEIANSSIFSRGNFGRILIGKADDFEDSYPNFSPTTIRIDNSTLNTNNSSVQGGDEIDAGGVSVRANESIFVTNASEVSSSTQRRGNAGAVFVQAPGDIELSDRSNIFSNAESGAVGDAGGVAIEAGSLSVLDGSQVQTLVRGASNDQPAAQGNAGGVIITARDTVTVSGIGSGGLPSAIFSDVGTDAVGNGGNVEIGARLLYLANQGVIQVDNQGLQGLAGNIDIAAQFVVLDREAQIRAVSKSGQGGNVFLQVPNLVGVSRGSNILTDTRSVTTGGNAGNISIDDGLGDTTLFVYGFPFRDNNITATANEGQGGNINISAYSLRNLAERTENSRTNDIDASSQAGVDGVVAVNNLDVDPDRGIVALPLQVADPRVSEGCDPRDRQETSRFIVTGRGGLSSNPTEFLGQDTTTANWVTASGTTNPRATEISNSAASIEPEEIVPARGWVVDANGDILLTAQASGQSSTINHPSWPNPASCNAF